MTSTLLRFGLTFALIAPIDASARSPAAPDPAGSVAAELSLLVERLSVNAVSSGLGERALQRVEEAIAESETRLSQGDWLASLRPLAAAQAEVGRVEFTLAHSGLRDMAGFEELCDSFEAEMGKRPSPQTGRGSRAAGAQALLENVHAQAWSFASGAREQGRQTTVAAGLYYLGSGRANAALYDFLLALEARPEGTPIGSLPGLPAYLERLRAELLELYQPPLSQERHATFIQLSASLKFARELLGEDAPFAALEAALEVRRGLSAFAEREAPDEQDEALRLANALEGWEGKLAASTVDTSLAQVFLNQARQQMEGPDVFDGTAAALLDHALPDYFACLGASSDALASEPAEVTITLVRWPFT